VTAATFALGSDPSPGERSGVDDLNVLDDVSATFYLASCDLTPDETVKL